MLILALALMVYGIFAQSLSCLIVGASVGMIIHSKWVKQNAKRDN